MIDPIIIKSGKKGVVKFLDIGDVHLSDSPPSIRVEGYEDQIFNKLVFIWSYAENHKVDFVLFKGDIFHQWIANRVSHRLTIKVSRYFKQFTMPVLIVPGNHDLAHDRVDSIEQQPLGEVLEALHIPHLGVAVCGDIGIIGVPGIMAAWDQEGIIKFVKLFIGELPKNVKYIICAVHQAISEKVKPYDTIPPSIFSSLKVDLVVFGHEHYSSEYFKIDNTFFCNFGAISRGSIGFDDLNRKPAFGLVNIRRKANTFETVIERVDIPHLPTEQVFDFTNTDKKRTVEEAVQIFMDSVTSTKFEQVNKEVLLARIEVMDIELEVKQCAKKLIIAVPD